MILDIEYLHVSAFTRVPGKGNSAAVCQLTRWPSDEHLAQVAQAIALPVTSYIVQAGEQLELRWMSKGGRYVQSMCGHGTLAASCAMALRFPERAAFEFMTPGGAVPVRHEGDMFFLALPRWDSRQIAPSQELEEALGTAPQAVYDAGRDTIALFNTEDEVRALAPDMTKLLGLGRRGFIATAAGHDFDCVSRFFCPSFGIGVDEDPVTGSAHCSIAPLWADRLKKSVVRAWQASAEGGELLCEVGPTTVTIGAPATPFERGRVSVDGPEQSP